MTNSRFAAAAEADRSNRDDRDRGPPPVANSRFAAAADADRPAFRDDRGPPPVANSRFAAAADADRPAFRDDRGPPPVANSRFAAAAMASEEDNHDRDARRQERDSFYNRGDDRNDNRGALQQNSRFAAAAAMDEDYVDRDERQRRMEQDRFEQDNRGHDDRGGGGGRYGGRDDDRGGGGGGGGRYGGRDDDRGGDRAGGRFGGAREDHGRRDGGGRDFPDRPASQYESGPRRSRVDDLLKPKAPVVADNILKAPDIAKLDPTHADNVLVMPTKALSKDAKEAAVEKPIKAEPVVEKEEPAAPVVDAAAQAEFLDEFASAKKLGDDLKSWCDERRVQLPSVKKLVFQMLTEREKLNPDPDCSWAEPSKFGAALLSLVGDDIVNQMQVLWGIQMYCDKLGFPKLNDEYVVQSMFRAMYKFDLAEADAFMEWKEDESDDHEQGKMKAVIQTVDWFNWLEEDDEEEEYEENEE